MLGFMFHLLYVAILMVYIYVVYIQCVKDYKMVLEISLVVGVIYPSWYDTLQLYKTGVREYLQDPFNVSDQIYIWGSIANVIL